MTQSSWAEYSIHAPTYSRDEYYFKKKLHTHTSITLTNSELQYR